MAQQQPSFGQRLGLLYKRWVLDCIPNLGHAVSVDFSTRPELYKQVNAKTAQQLTELQSVYGYGPSLPNDEIRLMLMKPIFGESDGSGSGHDGSIFQSSRMPVLAAAADFAENAQPTGFPMLRQRIVDVIAPSRRYMEDLEGASLNQTASRIESIFETATSVLKDANIASVFGVNQAINQNWPLDSTDSEGAKLIEKITIQLANTSYGVITRDRFVRMQRIAQQGQDSIRFILENDIESVKVTDGTLDPLIRFLYAWGSNLGLVGGATPQ